MRKILLENLDEGISIEHFEGNIEFKNVWFSYNDSDWILKNVSFKVNKGETCCLYRRNWCRKNYNNKSH